MKQEIKPTKLVLEGVQKYDLANLPQLEQYVLSQGSVYSSDVNTAILRFYQIEPQLMKAEVATKILVSAIMQLPKPDFKLLSHLVPEYVQKQEPIIRVFALAESLETSKFTQFWRLLTDESADLVYPGLQESVREYIFWVIKHTYHQITKQQLAEYLNMSGKELDAVIRKHVEDDGWTVKGDIFTLPLEYSSKQSKPQAPGTLLDSTVQLLGKVFES
eukprot:TRINITY_DN14125_c0_g1_i4.p1 TRINITY_DN14125_c0_g1~~TRINITY_DN14125_c0_g1_i4.p1  ORF type:complete len:217 (+),score=18.54 TRINITY_DN14125_c0_g1_i4:31-681(+)